MAAADQCSPRPRIWHVDTVHFEMRDSGHASSSQLRVSAREDASVARDHAGHDFEPHLQHARFCAIYFPPPSHCFVDNKAVRVMVAVSQG
jgi:hypothetical protein